MVTMTIKVVLRQNDTDFGKICLFSNTYKVLICEDYFLKIWLKHSPDLAIVKNMTLNREEFANFGRGGLKFGDKCKSGKFHCNTPYLVTFSFLSPWTSLSVD